ncbi:hypothetical protein GCM10027416_04900 [Okibacterium endophyticum]
MIRILSDTQICQGYANCLVTAPDHFDLDNDGKVSILNGQPTDADASLVREAVESCPVRALRLVETP